MTDNRQEVTSSRRSFDRAATEPDNARDGEAHYLPIGDASRTLGLHADAIRSRIRRGTLSAKKGNDGRLLVAVPAGLEVVATELEHGHDAALTELRAEIDRLRDQLTEEKVGRARAEAERDAARTASATEIAALRQLLDEARAWLAAERDRAARPWWRRLLGS